MAQGTKTPVDLAAKIVAFKKHGLSERDIAKRLGVARSTTGVVWKEYIQKNPSEFNPAPELIHAILPSKTRSARELVELAKQEQERRKEYWKARQYHKIIVNIDGPIGIHSFGDPHVDNPGCNWKMLENDINLVKNTKGLFAGCVGDYTDNWVGRLMGLYANSIMTQSEGHKLVEYFFSEVGDKWLYLIMGNHDHWHKEGGRILDWIHKVSNANGHIEPHDAKIELSFPNGNIATVRARHRFKGNSEINKLHGQTKAARYGTKYDVMIEGDRHTCAIHTEPFREGGNGHQAGKGIFVNMLQLGAYKEMDSYAEEIGFEDQNLMPSALTIINPYAKDPREKTTSFTCPELGADVLKYLRKKEGF